MIEQRIHAQEAREASLSDRERIIYFNRHSDEQQAAEAGTETLAQVRANEALSLEIAKRRQAKEDQQGLDALRASL